MYNNLNIIDMSAKEYKSNYDRNGIRTLIYSTL